MTTNRILTMSTKEIKRSEILRMADEKRITQRRGAKRIGVTTRHFRRLLQRYRKQGPEGIISGHRGKPSNNRMPVEKRKKILEEINTNYSDFGPTLASEKLCERNGIKVSKETVRQIMIEEGLHKPKVRQEEEPHPLRERMKHRGELVQIDGSPHAWLEDRAERACLLVFIDDATSEILAAKFVPSESYFAYVGLFKTYFHQHGLPKAFYSDRFSVFRVNHPNVTTTDAQTQYNRAMKELGIEAFYAGSPEAKGRVERVNQTLQDRLVKEMRLEGICDYEQANEFLPGYLVKHNHRFAVQPRSPIDRHEPLRPENDLDLIFTKRQTRTLSKNLDFQYDRVVYQIQTDRPTYALKNRKVTVCENEKGKITVLLNNNPIQFKRFHRQPKQNPVASSKDIERRAYKPAKDHPWRTYGKKINGEPVPAAE
jgi:transposase